MYKTNIEFQPYCMRKEAITECTISFACEQHNHSAWNVVTLEGRKTEKRWNFHHSFSVWDGVSIGILKNRTYYEYAKLNNFCFKKPPEAIFWVKPENVQRNYASVALRGREGQNKQAFTLRYHWFRKSKTLENGLVHFQIEQVEDALRILK